MKEGFKVELQNGQKNVVIAVGMRAGNIGLEKDEVKSG